jgi:hypothetical protein
VAAQVCKIDQASRLQVIPLYPFEGWPKVSSPACGPQKLHPNVF